MLFGRCHLYFYQRRTKSQGVHIWMAVEGMVSALISAITIAAHLLLHSAQVSQVVSVSDVRQANVSKDWKIGWTLLLQPLALILMGLCVWNQAQTCRKVNPHYGYKPNSIHKYGVNTSFTPSL